MRKPVVYVGCSLKHSPKDFKAEVAAFKTALRDAGYDVLEFLGTGTGTPRDVYETDINCVRSCEVFIAVCDLPSTGLGQEIQEAIHLRIPTVAVAHRGADVSRMVTGAAEVESTVQFARYDKLTEVIPLLKALTTPV